MTAPLSLSGLDLPRRNGDLAFDAPWQSTVFALAAAVIEHAFAGDREPFRQQLIKAIAAEPGRPYWESWTAALEALVPNLPKRSTPLHAARMIVRSRRHGGGGVMRGPLTDLPLPEPPSPEPLAGRVDEVGSRLRAWDLDRAPAELGVEASRVHVRLADGEVA